MKIFVLEISSSLMPSSQSIRFPKHNDDYGIEQDFMNFLSDNQEIVTTDPGQADWFYLPIYWTRWNLNNDYGKKNKDRLIYEIEKLKYPKERTFTICQYADGPGIPLEGVHVFLASRTKVKGHDAPLLCKPHNVDVWPFLGKFSKFFFKTASSAEKKYKASFRGRFLTHPIRKRMADEFKSNPNILFAEKSVSSKFFVKELLQSEIALCPRGHGGNSFRFYEAMQLGVVPFLIGDIDTRPFKRQINWDNCSFYSKSIEEVKEIIEHVPSKRLKIMSQNAKKTFDTNLAFGKWCELLVKEIKILEQ